MNYSWRLQQFDTDLFGYNTAKILDITDTGDAKEIENNIQLLVTELLENNIHYAVYRVPSNKFSLIHGLESIGFILVDGLLAMDISIEKTQPLLSKNIRLARMDDLSELKHIVHKAFVTNRFYNDPIIPKDKADLVYEKWIENSIKGDQADEVLVWEEEGAILGFVTLKKTGHIPLVAVAEKARGKGIAKKLIAASFTTFKKWKCEKIEIETTMNNISALRAYQGSGFKITASFLTFRWSDRKDIKV